MTANRNGALGLVLHQTRYELLAYVRNKRARIFTLAMPVALLVLFLSMWGDALIGSGAERAELATYYVPGLAALGVVGASFTAIAVSITIQRETGILKRRRSTPVPAWGLVLGRALATVGLSLAITAVLVAIGWIGFGVSIPASTIPGLLVTATVGSITFCSLGYALSTVLTSADGAAPLVNLALVPLLLISGVYYPSVGFPDWVQDVASVFPVQPLASGLHEAFAPGAHGLGVSATDLGVLAAWALAGLVVAVRRFSWMPKAATATS